MVRLGPLLRCLVLFAALQTGVASADDRLVRLALPDALAQSGLAEYMLPRFSLKTQVRVQVVAPGEAADAVIGTQGVAVFTGFDQQWHLQTGDHPGAQRFADWLTSDVGLRTITSYRKNGVQLFDIPIETAVVTAAVPISRDALRGATLSEQMCARCHAVNADGHANAVASTPSFAVLRSLPDWQDRFEQFYVRKPHPAFTQVAEVTPEFIKERPPTIVPLEMTLDDLDAILAYAAAMTPAQLGAPLTHQ